MINLRGETNHKVPLFLSMVIPGGGQIYNQKYIKAGIYIAAESLFIYGALIQDQRLNDARDDIKEMKLDEILDSSQPIDNMEFLVDRYKKERNNFIWISIGTVLLSAGDAYVDSYFSEFKRDIIIQGDKLSVSPTYGGLAFTYTW
jgi:TM2 domain-containing membrane protein YozV